MMNYREALDWLFATQLIGIKLGLDNPRYLLQESRAYPARGVPVIHVAGTNGKGSTCAMIESIARAGGLRCGLFTSPHLIDFRERIMVAGQQIPAATCAAMLSELRTICERMATHPTFFEITLTLAMRWFGEYHCDLIILETGMGGRWDATTAVPADVCVITPIGLDHMQWLGSSLADIAAEKAGILGPGQAAVSAPQQDVVREVLIKEAQARQVPLEFITQPLLEYPLALAGSHQQWNAALAVAALQRAGLHLPATSVREGLANVYWPGRFEEIQPGVILDGAHNPHAATVLAATWHHQFAGQPATLVFSAVAAKDIAGILTILAPLAARIFLCPLNSPRAVTAQELAAALPPTAPPHTIFDDFPTAWTAARALGSPILITGSLFLVGEARAFLTDRTFQPSHQ